MESCFLRSRGRSIDWNDDRWRTLGIDDAQLRLFRNVPGFKGFLILSSLQEADVELSQVRDVIAFLVKQWEVLEEAGMRFFVTRERIRQIETKALRKLRNPSRSQKLRDLKRIMKSITFNGGCS
jgi:hypothetical protein